MSALLQITIDTDETTERPNAPIVPSWYFLPSLIFTLHYLIPNISISTHQTHKFPENSTFNQTQIHLNRKTQQHSLTSSVSPPLYSAETLTKSPNPAPATRTSNITSNQQKKKNAQNQHPQTVETKSQRFKTLDLLHFTNNRFYSTTLHNIRPHNAYSTYKIRIYTHLHIQITSSKHKKHSIPEKTELQISGIGEVKAGNRIKSIFAKSDQSVHQQECDVNRTCEEQKMEIILIQTPSGKRRKKWFFFFFFEDWH